MKIIDNFELNNLDTQELKNNNTKLITTFPLP